MLTCLYCGQKNHRNRHLKRGERWICPACRQKSRAVGNWFCLPPNKLLDNFDFRAEKPVVNTYPGLPEQLAAPVLEIAPTSQDMELQSMTIGSSFTVKVKEPVLVPYGEPFWVTMPVLFNQVLEVLLRVEILTVSEQTEQAAVLELFVHEQIPIEQLPRCFAAVPLQKPSLADFHQSFSQRSMMRRGNVVRLFASCQDGCAEVTIVEASDAVKVVYYSYGFFQERETRIGNLVLPQDFYRQLIGAYQSK